MAPATLAPAKRKNASVLASYLKRSKSTGSSPTGLTEASTTASPAPSAERAASSSNEGQKLEEAGFRPSFTASELENRIPDVGGAEAEPDIGEAEDGATNEHTPHSYPPHSPTLHTAHVTC